MTAKENDTGLRTFDENLEYALLESGFANYVSGPWFDKAWKVAVQRTLDQIVARLKTEDKEK